MSAHTRTPRPRGRPPKPDGTARPCIVKVYLTETELRALDADRGEVTRSAYLAAQARISGR